MKNYQHTVIVGAFLTSMLVFNNTASAGGVFDFLDPCIKTSKDFSSQRKDFMSHIDTARKAAEGVTAPPEFRDIWMKAVRDRARPVFDKDVAPFFIKLGVTDQDFAFDEWFKQEMASYNSDQLSELINSNYREIAKEEVLRASNIAESKFEKNRMALSSSCQSDVGNQALRVALAPVGWIKGNIDGAQRENNVVTGVIRAVTGVSAKDIVKFGPLGGPNSELRKLANSVAGGENSEVRKTLRFMDPSNHKGILGGKNSEVRKLFGL